MTQKFFRNWMIFYFRFAFEIEKRLFGCFRDIQYSLHHSLSHWLVNFSWPGTLLPWRLMSQYSLYMWFTLEIRIDLGKYPFSDVRTSTKRLKRACLTLTACFGLPAPSTLHSPDLRFSSASNLPISRFYRHLETNFVADLKSAVSHLFFLKSVNISRTVGWMNPF